MKKIHHIAKSVKRRAFAIISIAIFVIALASAAVAQLKDTDREIPELAHMKQAAVSIGEKEVTAWIADTEELRTRGFSGVEEISSDQGMLFVFERSGFYGFWMNEMLMPLDMIWIDDEWNVVYIEKGVAPETFPQTFFPTRSARYVLEVRSGFSDEFGVEVGDQVAVEFIE